MAQLYSDSGIERKIHEPQEWAVWKPNRPVCNQGSHTRNHSARTAEELAFAVLKFFVPGHLDGFEFAFVRELWVALEAGEFEDPFMKVGEADGERVYVRMLFHELDADFFGVVPIKFVRHLPSPLA